jgi:beta-1,2-mannobiose phosphorylase / 1,2-beta-oligomannan phosphorylase
MPIPGKVLAPVVALVVAAGLITVFVATRPTAGPTSRPGEVPRELVSFGPPSAQALLAGTGTATWDRMTRERGWIMREADGWHLWYTGYNPDRGDARYLGYATSPDGVQWTRWPDNPLTSDGWVEDVCVVKQAGTYYMFAEGRDDMAHLLESTDRVHWQERGNLDIRLADGRPIPPGPRGTPAAWLENGTWWLFYEREDKAVFAATSKDMKVWTNVTDDPVLVPGPEPYDRHAIAVDQIVKHGGRYYAYYHASEQRDLNTWNTCLAVSDDLVHWRKYDRNPVLPVNPAMPGASSATIVDDGSGYRLYTTHPDVRLYMKR